MGYYTYYSVSVINADKVNHERIAEAAASLEYFACMQVAPEELEKRENPFEYIEEEGSCKWYDYAVDMRALSLKYPEMIFHIHGEGEENGDLWDHYFHNGKDERCNAEIVYPPAPAWAQV